MTDLESELQRSPEKNKTAARGLHLSKEIGKYALIALVVLFATNLLSKKLKAITWSQVLEGLQTIPPWNITLAVLVTILNFIVLTGYDLLAVRYLRKQLPVRKVMMGAVIGYALSNVFGWLIGGTALRYRLYSRWGFSLIEVVAFISFLSVTFWSGMFLLAGIAFVMLPVELPQQYAEAFYFPPKVFGWFFLSGVALYLTLTAVYRKPIKLGGNLYQLPPLGLSCLQLTISALDFALASYVLYLLLPEGVASYPNVLVAYMAGMVVTVTLHVPGGVGVLDTILLHLLDSTGDDSADQSVKVAVVCAIVMFRVIYYLLPALVSGLLLLYHELTERGVSNTGQANTGQANTGEAEGN
ncbi:MAG: YbhN family protein [Planctomycetota bacterium]